MALQNYVANVLRGIDPRTFAPETKMALVAAAKRQRKRPNLTNPFFNVDAYLAKGGKLSDVQLPSEESFPWFETILNCMSPKDQRRARSHALRVGMWLQLVGDQGAPEAFLREMSEEQAQALWRSACEIANEQAI